MSISIMLFQQPAQPPIHGGTDAMVDDAPGESDIPTNDVTVTTVSLYQPPSYNFQIYHPYADTNSNN
jgi:hypothetical protein